MSTPSPESVPEDVRNAADILGDQRQGVRALDERIIAMYRSRIAELEHYHNHFLKHSRVSIAGGIAYDTAKEDWEKRMREG